MTFLQPDRMNPGLLVRFARRRFAPNRADLIAMLLIGGGAVLVTQAARTMGQSLHGLNLAPVLANPGAVVLGDQVLVSDPADVNYWPVYSADGSKLVYLAGPIDNEGEQQIAVRGGAAFCWLCACGCCSC